MCCIPDIVIVNDGSCLDSLPANNFIFRHHEYTTAAGGEKCAQLTRSQEWIILGTWPCEVCVRSVTSRIRSSLLRDHGVIPWPFSSAVCLSTCRVSRAKLYIAQWDSDYAKWSEKITCRVNFTTIARYLQRANLDVNFSYFTNMVQLCIFHAYQIPS